MQIDIAGSHKPHENINKTDFPHIKEDRELLTCISSSCNGAVTVHFFVLLWVFSLFSGLIGECKHFSMKEAVPKYNVLSLPQHYKEGKKMDAHVTRVAIGYMYQGLWLATYQANHIHNLFAPVMVPLGHL